MRTVLIQGASTAAGWYDMESGGWVNRLSTEVLGINQNNPQEALLIQNDSVPGNTLTAILRDLSRVDRFQRLGKVTSILAIGLNESKIMGGMTRPAVSLARFESDLETYSEYMKARNTSTIYLGTELLLKNTILTDNGNVFEDDLVAEYDDLIKQRAEKEGMPYVDTRHILAELGHGVCEDGFHPNALGHTAIAAEVRDVLKNMGALVPTGAPVGVHPHSA